MSLLIGAKKVLTDFRLWNNGVAEAVLYVAVGLIGAAVDFGVFFLLIYFGLPLLVAQWLAALLGFLHNHLWHHFFVFKHNQDFRVTTFWSSFFSVVGVVVSGPAILLLQKVFDNFILNKVIILGITTIVLFCLRKFFIFKDKQSDSFFAKNQEKNKF